MNTIGLGSIVTWQSAANGSWKTKVGKVIEVVAPGVRPTNAPLGSGLPRNHYSYIVSVQPTPRSKPRFYWPVALKLTRVS